MTLDKAETLTCLVDPPSGTQQELQTREVLDKGHCPYVTRNMGARGYLSLADADEWTGTKTSKPCSLSPGSEKTVDLHPKSSLPTHLQPADSAERSRSQVVNHSITWSCPSGQVWGGAISEACNTRASPIIPELFPHSLDILAWSLLERLSV